MANKQLRIVISYSHQDENFVDEFRKHLAPLKSSDLIEDWYDRKIIPGHEIEENFFNNLENADICCLFISANFLNSKPCMKEKNRAFELKKNKGLDVVPIIVSRCGWLDDKDIEPVLALPEDGKAITKFEDEDGGWMEVYDGIKVVMNDNIKLKEASLTKNFKSFLQDTELLKKAHPEKGEVELDDIFVHPDLEKYDELRDAEKEINTEDLLEDFIEYSKILIAGEDQSSKTTLSKVLFSHLRDEGFFPVYINDRENEYRGKIKNKLLGSFDNQYEGIDFNEIDNKKVVPILDDFHYANNKEKIVTDLQQYKHQVLIVDDVFSLNFKEENLIKSYDHFKIKEFKPSLRNKIIKKWISLTDKKRSNVSNGDYKKIDKKTELVDTSLGKVIGGGIMRSYPFFILMVISNSETFNQPINQEITSQGHCYQTLLFIALRKEGVKSDEIETYKNFLTSFAHYLFKEEKNSLTNSEFDKFMKLYLEKYILPPEKKNLLDNLLRANVLSLDSFNNFSFKHSYLYYFFVGKYLAENLNDKQDVVDSILANLHKNENAYISVFLSHHSKKEYILDKVVENATNLFEDFDSATLSKKELRFFDEKIDTIIRASLPPTEGTPAKKRQDRLQTKNKTEKIANNSETETDDSFAIEMRRSVKTVEVMGRIIKNRAGSLRKEKLNIIFAEGIKVHLRILMSFLN